MGFDDRFIRMWEYYLALSEAGFATGHQPGPADRVREAARSRGRRSGLTGAGCARLPSGRVASSIPGPIRAPVGRLRDRVILITGSTGIAAATARPLRRRGRVGLRRLALGRPRPGARRPARRRSGRPSGWAAADLADAAEADAAVGAAVDRFGRIDGLFAVAGGSGRRYGDGPIHELTPEGWDRTLELNLRSQAMTCRAVVRQMLAQEPNDSGTRGSILLMGSVTATDPSPELFATHAYAAAKGATIALMTTMAATYAERPDPGQRRRAVADRHADGGPRRGRRRDPRLRRAQAAAGRRDDGPRRGRPRGRLLPVGRIAGRHRAAAQGRRRLVGRCRSRPSPSPVTFVRTVLGDIDPSELGVTYAHEHLVIDGGRPVLMEPDFDLGRRRRDGASRWPRPPGSGCGPSSTRCPATRAATPASSPSCRGGPASTSSPRPASTTTATTGRRTGATGSASTSSPTCSSLDVTDGIDALDYCGPVVRRTAIPGGRLKIAGSLDGPSERDRPVFEAAAAAHRRTGVPILTHCEAGTGALEQVRLLTELGVDPSHVALSHVDKVVDRGYHRELLGDRRVRRVRPVVPLGRRAERHAPSCSSWMVEDGLGDQIVLGMDAARQGYYRVVRRVARARPGCSTGSPRLLEARRHRRRDPPPPVRGQSGAGVRVRRGRSMSA